MNDTDLQNRELKILGLVRNALFHTGRAPSVRELMRALNYRSPRSVTVLLDRLIESGQLRRTAEGKLEMLSGSATAVDQGTAHTVMVPLLGNAPCGIPFLAQQNVERAVPVSVQLVRRPFHYFLLRAVGDSMDLAGIHSGDLVLVREQQDAENGQVVVALIDDEATIKEIHKNKDSIVLQPRSTNPANQPIVLHRDFQVQGVVIATIPKIKNSDANDHLT